MTIQDLILAVGSFIFSVALLPTIFNKKAAIPGWSSFLTAAVLSVFVGVYWSLGLWMTVFSGTTTAICWWFIFAFRQPGRETS
jgi:hypothetical protein